MLKALLLAIYLIVPVYAALGQSGSSVTDQYFISFPFWGTNAYKIATLPVSSASTADHIHLVATIGGWTSNSLSYVDAVFGNRNGFTYTYTERGVPVSPAATLTAYQNADGSVDVFIVFVNTFGTATYTVLENQDETVYSTPTEITTTPISSGTLLFDASSPSYPPATYLDLSGNLKVQGNATVGGKLYFPDGSALSSAANILTGSVNVTSGGTYEYNGTPIIEIVGPAGGESQFFGLYLGNTTLGGINNFLFGERGGSSFTTGSYNTGFGDYNFQQTTTGSNNAAFGPSALTNLVDGYLNVAIGNQAGSMTGANTPNAHSISSTFIGSGASPLTDSDVNEIAIGSNAVGLGSNTAVIGSTATTKTVLMGSVGIGTNSPSSGYGLEVNGNVKLTAGSGASITFADGTSLSSAANLNASPLISETGNVVTIGNGQTIDARGILRVGGLMSSGASTQGGYLGWNALTSGTGETDFINSQGEGPGGFAFFNSASTAGAPLTPLMFLNGAGTLGIGTISPSPSARLEVNGNIKLTTASGATMTFPDNTVQMTAWNGTTLGGDYAEAVDVLGDRSAYEPGDVITIDVSSPGKFMKSAKAYSHLVAGVYSTKPGLVGRRTTVDRPNKDAEIPMAMMGIVPTKVSTENGPIEPGDLLVSSNSPGIAMKGTDGGRMMGAVIGKALAPLKSGSGVIEVLVALQ